MEQAWNKFGTKIKTQKNILKNNGTMEQTAITIFISAI